MAEYIDKEKLLAEFDKQSKSADEHGRNFSFCFKSNGVPCTEWDAVELMVEDFQTEDVKPVVHGKWKHGVCQICFFDWSVVAPLASVPNFCPNCGADMREER